MVVCPGGNGKSYARPRDREWYPRHNVDSAQIPKKALIFGVSGQDGAYLAQLLLGKGYEVWGTSRDAAGVHPNLERLAIQASLTLLSADMSDAASVRAADAQAHKGGQ